MKFMRIKLISIGSPNEIEGSLKFFGQSGRDRRKLTFKLEGKTCDLVNEFVCECL